MSHGHIDERESLTYVNFPFISEVLPGQSKAKPGKEQAIV